MQFLVVTNLGQNLSPVSLRSRPRSAKSQDSCTFLVVTNLGQAPWSLRSRPRSAKSQDSCTFL